uniref:uncharacterized protein LOC124073781 isoform X2 n=1 Tax=Scatophagus argus TaxID=75038 RepID=UPI001ED8217C|nr:uncharacterized protein LOC124073781 isoform X2 [Scatophagus argus]
MISLFSFDTTHLKMRFKAYLMFLPLSFALECSQRNISCQDIKAPNGFKFKLSNGMPGGSEISVFDNQTLIAHGKDQFFQYESSVISMDNDSVTTRDCRDLTIKYIVPDGDHLIKEICMDYNTDKRKNSSFSGLSALWGLIIIPAILAVAVWITCIWIKKSKNKIYQEETEAEETSEMEFESCGTAENSIEQMATPTCVNIHSADPMADGNSLQSSLDHNLTDGGIQPSKNGGKSTYNLHRAPDHRDMHRNLRDDPGGVNDNRGGDILGIREMCNGWTPGPGHSLLVDQRSAIQGYDITGNTAVLVDKCSFDLDQFSRCSTDTDVE